MNDLDLKFPNESDSIGEIQGCQVELVTLSEIYQATSYTTFKKSR